MVWLFKIFFLNEILLYVVFRDLLFKSPYSYPGSFHKLVNIGSVPHIIYFFSTYNTCPLSPVSIQLLFDVVEWVVNLKDQKPNDWIQILVMSYTRCNIEHVVNLWTSVFYWIKEYLLWGVLGRFHWVNTWKIYSIHPKTEIINWYTTYYLYISIIFIK